MASTRYTAAQQAFGAYFRCHPLLAGLLETNPALSSHQGYFAFDGAVGYGRCVGSPSATWPAGGLVEAEVGGTSARGVTLPFDLAEVVTNLREERYQQSATGVVEHVTSSRLIQSLYYLVRPVLAVAARRHLQRVRLRGWQDIVFPRWPVDTSVDTIMRRTLALVLRHSDMGEVPFIWFWPDGSECSVVMTHDVEGPAGAEFCRTLMHLDEEFDIKSAYQIIPEACGQTTSALLAEIRVRGNEINLHDLNHDGSLFRDEATFRERAQQINRYTEELGCRGFRSGAMYRQQQWFDAFEFSYDMSVPNAAHLEPQRGGCCTVMPYFVGHILELPLTTTQDYSLFHILGEYSVDVWKQQIELVRRCNGFVSFIAHPDYLVESRARRVYLALLSHLRELREQKNIWMTLPGEVDRWWRNRQQMRLVGHGSSWRVEGPDSDRARVAYARLDGDRVVYSVSPSH
jgi:hypothetical protein